MAKVFMILPSVCRSFISGSIAWFMEWQASSFITDCLRIFVLHSSPPISLIDTTLRHKEASVIPKRYLKYVYRLRGLQDLLLVECNPLFYTVHHIFTATMRNRKARSVGGSVESLKHHRVFICTVVFRELTSQSLIRQV